MFVLLHSCEQENHLFLYGSMASFTVPPGLCDDFMSENHMLWWRWGSGNGSGMWGLPENPAVSLWIVQYMLSHGHHRVEGLRTQHRPAGANAPLRENLKGRDRTWFGSQLQRLEVRAPGGGADTHLQQRMQAVKSPDLCECPTAPIHFLDLFSSSHQCSHLTCPQDTARSLLNYKRP